MVDWAQTIGAFEGARALEREAFAAWRKAYCPSLSGEEAGTEHVKELHTTIMRDHNRNISVTVAILANPATKSEEYYFALQRTGNDAYLRREPK
jgi:hypothetical protein